MSRDIPTEAKVLVRRMTNDPRVNITNDWKLITILIGPNDFCLDFCYQRNPDKAPINHERDLITTLRILRDNLPRTVVNLVLPPSEYSKLKFMNFVQLTAFCFYLVHRHENYSLFTW